MKFNYKELIAYIISFISFVLPKIEVEEIILYGSVSRKEATKKSDIDIFFNTSLNEKKTKKIIQNQLNRFYKSKIYEIFSLKGINNNFHIEVGNLQKWKLKRSIISDGIVLYGKYKAFPEKLKGFTFFNLKPIKNITKRNKIIRKIFGRTEKNHKKSGLIKSLHGKKLSPSSFLTPIEKSNDIINYLNSEKIDFSFFEIWTDNIHI